MPYRNLTIAVFALLALGFAGWVFNQIPEPPQIVLGSITASSTTITASGYRTVTVSANACQTSIAAWGAGGGGAIGATNQGGAGGGGGAFASSTITTTPGQVLRLYIAPSTATEVNGATTTASTTAPTLIVGASGGTAATAAAAVLGGRGSIGDVTKNGGDGGAATTGTGDESGGGGGAGGPHGVGGNGGSCNGSTTVGCGGGASNSGSSGTNNTVTAGTAVAGTSGANGGTGDDGTTPDTVGGNGTYGGGGGGGADDGRQGSAGGSPGGGGGGSEITGAGGAAGQIIITEYVDSAGCSPTTVLNSPADASSDSDTTPTLNFTGTDTYGAQDLEYNVQVDTVNTFDSQALFHSYTNNNTSIRVDSGETRTEVGQSFNGEAGVLDKVEFLLRKQGTPTGNANAVVYAHTGTFGSGGTPTGAALATSDNFDVSTLTGSLAWTTLTFSGANKITLVAETKYVVVFKYTSGTSINAPVIAYDNATITDPGNMAYFTTIWNALAAEVPFKIYRDSFPLLSKFSVTPDDGFTAGHPFTSGAATDFTVQVADALTAGVQYFWRVAAIDPTGSNTYGAWSSTRSFTVTSAAVPASVSPANVDGIINVNGIVNISN